MGVSNNAGLGFVVAGIGGTFFGSLSFGVLLYVCQLAASLISAHLLFSKNNSVTVISGPAVVHKKPLYSVVTRAVSDASLNFVKICGFVIFFSAVSGFIMYFSGILHLPVLLSALLISFLEVTGACSSLAAVPTEGYPILSCCVSLLTFFAVGFSGLSVHLQTCSLAFGYSLNMKNYFLIKLLSGVVCAFLGAVFFIFAGF